MNNHFRTILQPKVAPFSIGHNDAILLTGSCFSENIGTRLKTLKFNALNNPFGIGYNPVSIHQSLLFKDEPEILESEGIHFSYTLHSQWSSLTEKEVKKQFEQQKQIQQDQLSKKGFLILTYGTAWVYELKSNSKIVNNCHKQNSSLFRKRLLSVKEITASFFEMISKLEEKHQPKHVLFTISPVRHLKDGFHENQLSKATLQLAVQEICSTSKQCSYFPSYEIMMDDLRDYRFYKNDLLHPNQQAIDYIWQQFSSCYFTEVTQTINEKIRKINTSLQHKAFQPESKQHQQFLTDLLERIDQLSKESTLDFNEEISSLHRQLV